MYMENSKYKIVYNSNYEIVYYSSNFASILSYSNNGDLINESVFKRVLYCLKTNSKLVRIHLERICYNYDSEIINKLKEYACVRDFEYKINSYIKCRIIVTEIDEQLIDYIYQLWTSYSQGELLFFYGDIFDAPIYINSEDVLDEIKAIQIFKGIQESVLWLRKGNSLDFPIDCYSATNHKFE